MPMLTDQDVRERMDWLTANGFPGTERGWVNRCVNVSGGIFPLLG